VDLDPDSDPDPQHCHIQDLQVITLLYYLIIVFRAFGDILS
jgi:hypothetical protein